LLRNSFCKRLDNLRLNLFRIQLSILVAEELFLQVIPLLQKEEEGILSILVAEELFLQEKYIVVWMCMLHTFQSSLLRNSFCKYSNTIVITSMLHHLSILVAEELFLQGDGGGEECREKYETFNPRC